MPHHCGMCGHTFGSRGELSRHTATHEEIRLPELTCPVCPWTFEDSHSLEQHQIQTGHYTRPFACETCTKTFTSIPAVEEHQRKTPGCRKDLVVSTAQQLDVSAKVITCDRCPNIFTSQRKYKAHRSFPNGACADFKKQKPRARNVRRAYIDLDQPQQKQLSVLSHNGSSDTPVDMSDSEEYCHDCKTVFESKARYNNHALACSAQKRARTAMAKASPVVEKSIEAIQPMVKSSRSTESIQPMLTQTSKFVVGLSRATPLLAINNNAQQSTSLLRPVTAPEKSVESIQPALPQGPKFGIDTSRAPPIQGLHTTATDTNAFSCTVKGCKKSCRSEAGLKIHKMDAHGIGGKALDLSGRESFMLGSSARNQLRAEGLLRSSSAPRGRGGRGAPLGRPPAHITANRPSPTSTLHPRPSLLSIPMNANRTITVASAPVGVLAASHGGPNPIMIGSAEMEQGKHIQGKILRLLIQNDIFVCPDGVITACGIDWNRLSVSTQQAFVDHFDTMCHLPKVLQGSEYLPPPKAFKNDYAAQYPVTEFEASPNRNPAHPGLNVVALTCSKVILANGCQEIVKIAAVDVTTCRILMSHLVCTNPEAQVANWNSAVTGLFAWSNMEEDRQAGYKVFKGWSAARSALWKFVDKDTILVGHNLRADLDALRMIHGRAIDMAKVVEKAAKGPLSKQQLSLDSLCRDYPKVILKSDPEYGRDCLMNAFAIRQLGCWILKNQEKLSKDAKQKEHRLPEGADAPEGSEGLRIGGDVGA